MTDGEALFRPARGHSSRRKGFISFMLAAVFLFSLIPAAMLVSSRQPDLSFEDFRATLVGEVAIKQAFYQSARQAAEDGCRKANELEDIAAAAHNIPPPKEPIIIAEIYGSASRFEDDLAAKLRAQGSDFSLWCGSADDYSRREASEKMAEVSGAVAPSGTNKFNPLLPPPCVFWVSLNRTNSRIIFENTGFSLYSRNTGIGKAAAFPHTYEVSFTCVKPMP
ncbi:MAG: hypothetical protein WCT52_06135 [Candidatus Micrarchaeia archaeon]